MKAVKRSFPVVFFWAVLLGGACFAQTLDQSFTGPLEAYWLSSSTVQPMAQVYTAGITGNLEFVKISVSAQSGGPVVVEILNPNGQGNGTWPLLGFTEIKPPSQLKCAPTCQLIKARFNPPVSQVAGTQYAIAVYPAYVAQEWYGSINGSGQQYPDGGTWVYGPSWVDITGLYPSLPSWEQVLSFYFQTYVEATR